MKTNEVEAGTFSRQAPMLLSGFGLWLEEKISFGKFQGWWTKALPYGKARESSWICCFVGLH